MKNVHNYDSDITDESNQSDKSSSEEPNCRECSKYKQVKAYTNFTCKRKYKGVKKLGSKVNKMAGDRLTKINEIKAMKQELKAAKEIISNSSEENANLKSELEVQQNLVKILKA